MSLKLFLQPEAEGDIQEAYLWYEEQDEGLGEEFLRAVDAGLAAVQRMPNAHAPVYRNIRRVLLRRFPYSVFYFIEDERIIVLGCFHVRRDPKSWQDRL